MAALKTHLCLALILAVRGAGMAQCPRAAGGPQAVSLKVRAVQRDVTAGAPVFVEAVVTNESNDYACIWSENAVDQVGYRYQADVREATGSTPPETKFGFYHDRHINLNRMEGSDLDGHYLSGSGTSFPLKAGGSLTDKVDVSRLYDLDKPGAYTIVLSLTEFPAVRSNAVTVTVVPAPGSATSAATAVSPAHPAFSVELPIGHQVPNAHPPLNLIVITRNVSDHRIVLRRQEHALDQELLGPTLRVDVSNSQGHPAPDTQLGRSRNHLGDVPPDASFMASARAAGTLISLQPGQEWLTTIPFGDLYDLRKPGDYTVQVRRWDNETKTWVKSNTITLTVAP